METVRPAPLHFGTPQKPPPFAANPFVPTHGRPVPDAEDPALLDFDLSDPNRFFQASPPLPAAPRSKPPGIGTPNAVPAHDSSVVLYSGKGVQHQVFEAILDDPVGSLFMLCTERRLPKPQFFGKYMSATPGYPLGRHGMEVVVDGMRKATPIAFDSKKDAEVAAALLGLQVLGVPVHLANPKQLPRTQPPTAPSQQAQRAGGAFATAQSTLDAMEPNLGTMGNTYYQALQRLIHRYNMLMPKLVCEALSTFPPRHLVVFDFYGQHFEAVHSKKTDAKQLVCKQAYEFFSKHPDFTREPKDYRALLANLARAKKWHSPKFFDPSNGTAPVGAAEMGVIINDFEFIEKWPSDLSSTGAKQLVAKKAYEQLAHMEQRVLPSVAKRLPLTCSVSQVEAPDATATAPSTPFMKSRYASGPLQPSVRKAAPAAAPEYYGTTSATGGRSTHRPWLRAPSPSNIRFDDGGGDFLEAGEGFGFGAQFRPRVPYNFAMDAAAYEDGQDALDEGVEMQTALESEAYYNQLIHPDEEDELMEGYELDDDEEAEEREAQAPGYQIGYEVEDTRREYRERDVYPRRDYYAGYDSARSYRPKYTRETFYDSYRRHPGNHRSPHPTNNHSSQSYYDDVDFITSSYME